MLAVAYLIRRKKHGIKSKMNAGNHLGKKHKSIAKKRKKGKKILGYDFRLLRENRNNSPSIAATGMAIVVNSGTT